MIAVFRKVKSLEIIKIFKSGNYNKLGFLKAVAHLYLLLTLFDKFVNKS